MFLTLRFLKEKSVDNRKNYKIVRKFKIKSQGLINNDEEKA